MLEAYRRAGADQVILIAFARERAAIAPALEKLADGWLQAAHRLA
jgi:hypothetical protein